MTVMIDSALIMKWLLSQSPLLFPNELPMKYNFTQLKNKLLLDGTTGATGSTGTTGKTGIKYLDALRESKSAQTIGIKLKDEFETIYISYLSIS